MDVRELDRLAAALGDPHLKSDYGVLRAAAAGERSPTAFDLAVRARRRLAADTLAPQWLRDYAVSVVEAVRPFGADLAALLAGEAAAASPADRDEVYVGLGDFDGSEAA